MLELSNFGNSSGSGTKKGYKRVQSKSISDKAAKKIKSTNTSITSPISSLELAKWKSLIKFNNQPEVPLSESLGKTDEKLYILGRNELEWYGKVEAEQYKIRQRKTTCTTVPKGDAYLFIDHI